MPDPACSAPRGSRRRSPRRDGCGSASSPGVRPPSRSAGRIGRRAAGTRPRTPPASRRPATRPDGCRCRRPRRSRRPRCGRSPPEDRPPIGTPRPGGWRRAGKQVATSGLQGWRGSGRGGGYRGTQLPPPPGEELRLVHPEHGDRLPVALVDGEETALLGVALDDPYGVAVLAVAGELDADAVLVGPEVGRRRTVR